MNRINDKKSVIGMVMLLLIVMVLSACQSKTNNSNPNRPGEDNNYTQKEFSRMIAVVKNIDTVNNKLYAFNIETEELLTLQMDGAVDLQNKFGDIITLAQVKIGDMVRVKYEVESLIPEFVQITAEVWEQNKVTGVRIDIENNTVQRANDKYTFTEDVLVLYNGRPVDLEQITSLDQVTLRGYRDKVWVIILENGHGFVELRNQDYFIGGTIEIGSGILQVISDEVRIPVQVGVYKVVIEKKDLQPVEREIMVEKDQVVVIDLSGNAPKEGDLKINLSQTDARVYINGQRYQDFTKPIRLPFGDYVIVAEKDGYARFEETITFNQLYMNYNVNLEKTYKYLHVNSPTETEIYLNGNYIGIIPVSVPVEPGQYTVTLRKEGHFSKLETIEIRDDGRDSFFTFPELIKMQQDSGTNNNQGQGDSGNTNPTTDVYQN